MAYYEEQQLRSMGFRSLGRNVKISDKACIYDTGQIDIGDNSRIDDFCILSGRVSIGSYCHITPMCLVAGGSPGIFMADFCTLAYGAKVFSQSDDYSGESLTNSLIPKNINTRGWSRFSCINTLSWAQLLSFFPVSRYQKGVRLAP